MGLTKKRCMQKKHSEMELTWVSNFSTGSAVPCFNGDRNGHLRYTTRILMLCGRIAGRFAALDAALSAGRPKALAAAFAPPQVFPQPCYQVPAPQWCSVALPCVAVGTAPHENQADVHNGVCSSDEA